MVSKRRFRASAAVGDQHELLALLEAGNSGAKLSLFADWAAGRDPVEVERALRTLEIDRLPTPAAESNPIRRKARLLVMPRRS